jgi:CxxC motif-containing protein (DUF1111 family)
MKKIKNQTSQFQLATFFAMLVATLSSVMADDEKLLTNYVDDQSAMSLDEKISAGRRKFGEPWSLRNELDGVWGLGPTYNEVSCPGCHQNALRAAAPGDGRSAERGMVLRLSIPGQSKDGGPLPHPHYGDQLQNRSIAKGVPREGRVIVHYDPVPIKFADGETVLLRKPRIELRDLQFGELDGSVMMSPRMAPPVFGLGLLEAVPELSLLEIAKQQISEGVSGKPNYVWDEAAGKLALGRFGWKANQPNIRQQIAAALLNDIGATSSLFPVDNCPGVQTACRSDSTTTDCGGIDGGCAGQLLAEVLPSRLETLTVFLQSLAPPERSAREDEESRAGEKLFSQAGCAACHVPKLKTGATADMPSLSNVTFRAYTDLLLHDMGEELADGRPDFLADGREWRTAPLWRLGLMREVQGHSDLLHDGRARNIAEAILWHGGEAQAARDVFRQMSKAERAAVVKFAEGL